MTKSGSESFSRDQTKSDTPLDDVLPYSRWHIKDAVLSTMRTLSFFTVVLLMKLSCLPAAWPWGRIEAAQAQTEPWLAIFIGTPGLGR
jgi:hypothetical protein